MAGFMVNEGMHAAFPKEITARDFRVVRGYDDLVPGTERLILPPAQAASYAKAWKKRAGSHFTVQICLADEMSNGALDPTADRNCQNVG
ncbi:MAG: hypothetical protein JWN90_709 [Parcubacteria group bacterium]|nr:hypothetical protein [Parcubacteria group bacterium]